MRNRSPLVQSCAIIIPLAHSLIFLSLFFPVQIPLHHPGEPPCLGWQRFFPCNPSPSDLRDIYLPHIVDYVIIALSALIVLALPPLASVAVFRSRWRRIGLLGMWISLPLTLASCLIFVVASLPAFAVHQAASPAVWLPPPGFALSFLACLVLALRLPLIGAHEQTRVPVSRSVHLEAGQHESAERVSSSSEAEAAHATRWGPRLLFAFIGLLCHLAIGLSLFFTYTVTYYFYGSPTPPHDTIIFSMGWQLLGEAFQAGVLPAVVAIVLLAALVLPIPIYLTYLLPSSWKSDRTDRWHFPSASSSRVLSIIGLSLSGSLLMLSLMLRGGDLHDPVRTTHLAFVVPPVAFLLSLLCSTVLIGSGLRRHTG